MNKRIKKKKEKEIAKRFFIFSAMRVGNYSSEEATKLYKWFKRTECTQLS